MDQKIIESLLLSVESLFRNADRKMMANIHDFPDSFQLAMPEFIKDELIRNMYRITTLRFSLRMYDLGEYKYRGITVVDGYENAFILYHKDYPLYKEESMISKILLP